MTQDAQLPSEPTDIKSMELAFQAVMAEYQAIRETALSRDRHRNRLMNYNVVLLGAAVTGLEYLVKSGLFIAFLVLSVLFSALGLIYIFNSKNICCYFIIIKLINPCSDFWYICTSNLNVPFLIRGRGYANSS